MKAHVILTVLIIANVVLTLGSVVIGETVFVDSRNGLDSNPGTREKPLRTIGQAAAVVHSKTQPGPTTIKIAPGVYNLTESVVFEIKRSYTEKKRLIIEASVLPDDPQWKPEMMPVILSTEDARKSESFDSLTETYGFKIKNSHVTIRGLKFLGNPLQNNWYCAVSRIGKELDDLVVTQCMFLGDKDSLDIYCAALATGDKFVVDHCIFYNCHASVVFWDGTEGIGGKGCAMTSCIVDGGYISGVWTCQTAEDFEFHHNIVTRSQYFWMRKRTDRPKKYKLRDCIISNNKYYSGYGIESGPISQTGPEVTFEGKNVTKTGEVTIVKDKRMKNYLHVTHRSLGSNLGAGLFKR